MASFIKLVKSVDVFGESVSLNYKGDSEYKTMAGAIITIIIKSFMVVYGVTHFRIVYNYEDPKISQVSWPRSVWHPYLDCYTFDVVHAL